MGVPQPCYTCRFGQCTGKCGIGQAMAKPPVRKGVQYDFVMKPESSQKPELAPPAGQSVEVNG